MPKGSLLILLLFTFFITCECQKDNGDKTNFQAKEETNTDCNGIDTKRNVQGQMSFKTNEKRGMEEVGEEEEGEAAEAKRVRRASKWEDHPQDCEHNDRRSKGKLFRRSVHSPAHRVGESSKHEGRLSQQPVGRLELLTQSSRSSRSPELTTQAPAAVETRPLKVWLRGVHSLLNTLQESTTNTLNLQNLRLKSSSTGNYPEIMDVTKQTEQSSKQDATIKSVARSRSSCSQEIGFPASPETMSEEIKSFVRFLMSSNKSQHDMMESSTKWRSELSRASQQPAVQNIDHQRLNGQIRKTNWGNSADGLALKSRSLRKKVNWVNTRAESESNDSVLIKSEAKAKKNAKKTVIHTRTTSQSSDFYDEHILANFATDQQSERTNSRPLKCRNTPKTIQADRYDQSVTESLRRLSSKKNGGLNVQDYDFEIEEYDDLAFTSVRSAEKKGKVNRAGTTSCRKKEEEFEQSPTEEELLVESKKKAKSREEEEVTLTTAQDTEVNMRAMNSNDGEGESMKKKMKLYRSKFQGKEREETKEMAKINVHRPLKGRPAQRERVADGPDSGQWVKGRSLNQTEVVQRLLMPGCCYVVVSKGAESGGPQRQRQRVSVLVPRAKCPKPTPACPPPPVKLSLCLGLCLGTVAVPQGEQVMSSLIDLIKGQISTTPTCRKRSAPSERAPSHFHFSHHTKRDRSVNVIPS